MPIRIVADGQYDKPVIYCDHCGEPILKAEEGNYQYKSMGTLEQGGTPIMFTHKRCCSSFDRTDQGRSTGAVDLASLLVFLVDGLKVDLKEARQRAGFLNRVDPTV